MRFEGSLYQFLRVIDRRAWLVGAQPLPLPVADEGNG